MRFDRLDDWLSWQEQLHPREIELGLTRVRRVADRLGIRQPAPWVFVVAGTNGKGSVSAILSTMLSCMGYRNATFTSPHLLKYNERIVIDGHCVNDQALCQSFERIDQARGQTPLTYFEFGTLAALDLIGRSGVEVAILEVGLGGRLDAVNIVDSDCAIVTGIGIDHTDWLGDTREQIALEKAGIFRSRRPAICGDPDPPKTLLQAGQDTGAILLRYGVDFEDKAIDVNDPANARSGEWSFVPASNNPIGDRLRPMTQLPPCALVGSVQRRNCATALAAIMATLGLRAPEKPAIAAAIGKVDLPGRCQVLSRDPEIILDVGHNPDATGHFAQALTSLGPKKTHGVLAMLADKDIVGVLKAIHPQVDHWHLAPLPGPRGARCEELEHALEQVDPEHHSCSFESVTAAYQAALDEAGPQDRIVVMGSFLTVQAVLGYNAGFRGPTGS